MCSWIVSNYLNIYYVISYANDVCIYKYMIMHYICLKDWVRLISILFYYVISRYIAFYSVESCFTIIYKITAQCITLNYILLCCIV